MTDPFLWDKKYETGNAEIDHEHKKIFSAAVVFQKAVAQNLDYALIDKAFHLILDYTQIHFKNEEGYFEKRGCPLLKIHRDLHSALVNDVREMWHEKRHGLNPHISTDLENWIHNRLIPHIMDADQQALASIKK